MLHIRSERGATAIDYLNNLKKLCKVETISVSAMCVNTILCLSTHFVNHDVYILNVHL